MHLSCKTLALTLTSLCALGLVAIHPAAAQELTYKLSGVTFADGATASGYFNFDPTTQTGGSYDFTTTSGISDGERGETYLPGAQPFLYSSGSSFSSFNIASNSANPNFIAFVTNGLAVSPGTFTLIPGTVENPNAFYDSGEFAPEARAISGGFLIVSPAAVPEASTTVSFGLLLALGLGGVVIAARKKKTAVSAPR